MTILGHLEIEGYLRSVNGLVTGRVNTDARNRYYRRKYAFDAAGDWLVLHPTGKPHRSIRLPKVVDLTEPVVAFFGLYSGDGAKGTETEGAPGQVTPVVSFSQREKHIVHFAADQFRLLFPGEVGFVFSVGEDSAHFLAGEGRDKLDAYYRSATGGGTPPPKPLSAVRPKLSAEDRKYLSETRPDIRESNESLLAHHFQHKEAMEAILVSEKTRELERVGIVPAPDTRVTASVRRPYKKGARGPGGSSRSDELSFSGLWSVGELFLKMLGEIEDSILRDVPVSSQGLVRWSGQPSKIGEVLDNRTFFTSSPYGKVNGRHPTVSPSDKGLVGQRKGARKIRLRSHTRIDPLWCFAAGLYLAEGSTPKRELFRMFRSTSPNMHLSFTTSDGSSLELMLRALRALFFPEDCLDTWKVKVGNQYFPELAVSGFKHGVPMLRGGPKGEGKLRTMEISLVIKDWALGIADAPLEGKSLLHSDYTELYTHVEPTGAGVARIDFTASSALCRWYFPLLMFTVFGRSVPNPAEGFRDD